MSYIDVIPLQEAKDYLGVDDNARDSEITRMIKSACLYVEKYTNIILFSREKTYYKSSDCIRVYDFPINTNIEDSKKKATYTEYQGDDVTLNVGYLLSSDVPTDLIDTALQIVAVWFYNSEKENKTSLIPESAKMVLDINKRFLV